VNFYKFDDLSSVEEQYKTHPNKQYANKWCDAWAVDRINGTAEKCPLCGRPVSVREWLEPRKMRLTNTRYPDRLSNWLSEPLVVSERFKELFLKEALRGISSFNPIEVVKVSHSPMKSSFPKYYQARIDYSTEISVDASATLIQGQPYDGSCSLCNPFGSTVDKINRLVLDVSGWTGSDILRVYGIGVVMSQGFFDFVEKHQFTNFPMVLVETGR